jgi:ArsR family transcriptional regulator, arsenate/arsenite/antimonite-responsive transcriptional repressor
VCQYVPVQTIAVIAAGCPPLLTEPISREAAEQLAAPLKALADPARLRILSLIQAQPGGEACVCHLTEPLDLTQGTVSHHLRVLREAGLVERDQRGSWAHYRVVPASLEAVRSLLAP